MVRFCRKTLPKQSGEIAAAAYYLRRMKTIFITGATAGFGEACAHLFAKNGYRLLLNGRRLERLETLKEKLENAYAIPVYLLPFDVQNREKVFTAISRLPESWQEIDVLINNAGLALGRDLFDNADLNDWETMIDTNVKGLLYVSKAVIPYMIKRKMAISSTLVLWRQRCLRTRQRVLCLQSSLGYYQQGHAHRPSATPDQGYCRPPRGSRNRILACSF
jgi:short-subunit dehydrogenase